MLCFSRFNIVARYSLAEFLPALVAGAAALGGAGISAASASSLNKKTMEFNREEAGKGRLFQQEMYWQDAARVDRMRDEDRDYQTQMANTQVQRHVADLTAAGLNPIMAAGGTAQVPSGPQVHSSSGGSASTASVGGMDNPGAHIVRGISAAVSSALEYKRLKKDIDIASQEIKESQSRERSNKEVANKTNIEAANALLHHEILKNEVSSSKAVNDYKKKDAEIESEPWIMYPKKAMEVLKPVTDTAAKAIMMKKGIDFMNGNTLGPGQMILNKKTGEIIRER